MKFRFSPLSIILLLILVSTGSAQMFESFEYGVPPAGWIKTNLQGGTGWYQLPIGWAPLPGWGNGTSSVPATAGAGTHNAYCSWDTGGSAADGYHNDQWLISPRLTGLTATSSLSYWLRFNFTNYPDQVFVRISTAGPVPANFTYVIYTNNFTKQSGPGQFPPWTNTVLNIGSLGIAPGTPIWVAIQEYVWDNTWNGAAVQLDVISSDVTAPPEARTSPTSLTFTAYYDGTDPAAQTFSLQSVGSSGMGFSRNLVFGAGPTNWLTLSGPSSGTLAFQDGQVFTASVSVAGLELGTHCATNVITVPGATNSPIRIPITFNVIRRPQTITFPNPGPQYTTNRVGLAGTASSGLPVTFSVYSGPGVVTGATNLTFTSTGTVKVVGWQLGNVYYEVAPCVTNSITVSKPDAAIVFTDMSHVYDGSPHGATVTTVPAGLTVDTTYNGSPSLPVAIGTYAVTSSVNDTLYDGLSVATFTITRMVQTITFPDPGPQWTTNLVGLAATANSGLPVSFSVASGPGLISGGTNLSFSSAGTVSVVASHAGDADWLPAAATNSIVVTKVTASVTLNDLNQTYNGTPRVVTATTSPTGLTVNVTYDGSGTAPTAAGTYAVTGTVNDAMYQGADVGTLTVSKADQTIAFPDLQPRLTNAVVALGASASSGLPVTEFAVISGPGVVNGTNLTFTGAGDVLIAALQSGNGDWNPAPAVTNLVKAFSVNPTSGPAAGGNEVLITNGRLGNVTNVTLCGIVAMILDQGTNWVSVRCGPSGVPGTGDLVIQSDSEIVVSNAYTYNPAGIIGRFDTDWTQWQEVAGLPAPRAGLAAGTQDGLLYAIGGRDGVSYDKTNMFVYNGTDWLEAAGLPTQRYYLAVGTLGGALHAVGGWTGGAVTNVYRYNGTNWLNVAGLPSTMAYQAAGTWGDDLYAIGGVSGAFAQSNVFRYNGTNWTVAAGIPSPRYGLAAGTLGGSLYAIGGQDNGGTFRTNVYRYNGTNWQEVVGLPAPRFELAAGTLGGALYAIGGQDAGGFHTNVYRYNGTNWQEVAGLPSPRYELAGGTLDNSLYAFGGRNGSSYYTNAYRYPALFIEPGVEPSSGSYVGGYQVSITGTNLCNGDVTNVRLCGVTAALVSQSPTQIVVTAGAGAIGLGDVRVFSVSFGETVKSNAFTYAIAEMSVLGTNGALIVSGESAESGRGTDFGSHLVLGAYTNWFAITNSGDAALSILGVTTNGSDFFSARGLPSSVLPGAAVSFSIVYAPTAVGVHTAAVWLANDSTNAPFIINVAGTAIKRDQDALDFSPTSPQAYLTTNALSTTGGSGTGDVSYTIVSGPGAIVGGTGLTITGGSGSVLVRATKAGDDFYNSQSVTGVVAAAKSDQTIGFTPLGAQFTTNRVGLQAEASSGLPPAFMVDSGPALITGGTNLSFSGVGTVVLMIDQVGDANWNPAPVVTNTFTVTKAVATVTLNHVAQTYDGTPRVVTADTTPAGLPVVITYGGSATAPTNVGAYSVLGTIDDAIYTGGASGTLTVGKATQAINFAQIPHQRVTNIVHLSATASSGLLVTFSIQSGAASITNGTNLSIATAGRITVRASQAGDANWSAAQTDVTFAAGLSVPLDFDGDGITDVGVYRSSSNSWFVWRSTAGALTPFAFGINNDMPVPADFDGDGLCDAAVFRPATATWYIFGTATGPWQPVVYGTPVDLPIPADFDGDGKADFAVLRPASMTWYIFGSSEGSLTPFVYGAPGDLPIPADFDGDGLADPAVFRRSTMTWYAYGTSVGPMKPVAFGAPGDIPVPGDYDGDQRIDFGVFRPANATWYLYGSTAGPFQPFVYGLPTDVPLVCPRRK